MRLEGTGHMADTSEALGVAIVGCGTVGRAVATILTRDQAVVRDRLRTPVELRRVVDVDLAAARSLGLDESLLTSDLDEVLADPRIGAVAELVGGTTTAKEIIVKALRAGKHVVTANKALLAHHGPELYGLARRCGLSVSFEASCAGGVPVIRAICDGLIANRIDAIYGIVNGTCNYILTEMTQSGSSYADALARAQADGLAEADPTLDVSGTDSAHKLAVMAAIAFARKVDLEAIPVEGIDKFQGCDMVYGQELGYVVKLLAMARRHGGGLSLRVRPAFIPTSHPLAWISGPFNAVSIYGHATGHTMYYGRGAGGMPTASAVVADLAAVAMGTAQRLFDCLDVWPDRTERAVQLPTDDVRSRYYIRVMALDRPGVFAQIAAIVGRHDISICSALQHEPADSQAASGVPVVITTHVAREGNVRNAIAEIDALDVIGAETVCVDIVDEHPEDMAEAAPGSR